MCGGFKATFGVKDQKFEPQLPAHKEISKASSAEAKQCKEQALPKRRAIESDRRDDGLLLDIEGQFESGEMKVNLGEKRFAYIANFHIFY